MNLGPMPNNRLDDYRVVTIATHANVTDTVWLRANNEQAARECRSGLLAAGTPPDRVRVEQAVFRNNGWCWEQI